MASTNGNHLLLLTIFVGQGRLRTACLRSLWSRISEGRLGLVSSKGPLTLVCWGMMLALDWGLTGVISQNAIQGLSTQQGFFFYNTVAGF